MCLGRSPQLSLSRLTEEIKLANVRLELTQIESQGTTIRRVAHTLANVVKWTAKEAVQRAQLAQLNGVFTLQSHGMNR